MDLQSKGAEPDLGHTVSATESTITVKAVLMGELKRWAGRRDVEVILQPESTVQTLVKRLSDLCGPDFARRALTKEMSLQPHVAVFVDGVHIGELNGTQTVLHSGQVELMMLPSFEGGSGIHQDSDAREITALSSRTD